MAYCPNFHKGLVSSLNSLDFFLQRNPSFASCRRKTGSNDRKFSNVSKISCEQMPSVARQDMRQNKEQKLSSDTSPSQDQRNYSVIDALVPLKHPGIARVVLKRGKAFLFLNGSPIVYSGAIDKVVGRPPPKTGDTVLVQDHTETTIGWGLFNSVSMYRVRLMQSENEARRDSSCTVDMESLLQSRIKDSINLRKALGLPSSHTTVFRLLNSEGDRLSGLVIDQLGPNRVVIASSAAWTEQMRPQITAILEQELANGEKQFATTWRASKDMLKEEGWTDGNVGLGEAEALEDEEVVEVLENGIRYLVSPSGQKTGFYADQRDSRKLLGSVCAGKSVLDLCCYSGGFSLAAMAGGASSVCGVDSSLAAIELAKKNTALNGFSTASCRFVQADISNFMRDSLSAGQSFDVVILDPPKLAPNKKVLEKASIRYRKLNAMAMQLVNPGGLLMTCSCSGAVAQSGVFPSILQKAASMAGRNIKVLRTAGPGADHPIDYGYPEGAYLTNVLLQVL